VTHTQLDHLRAIDAHLDTLLALSAKRSPGEWIHSHNVIQSEEFAEYLISCNSHHTTEIQDEANAAFIAACAGRAEAGWRSTHAIVKHALMVIEFHPTRPTLPVPLNELEESEDNAQRILAAWPLELLKL
jgi:hypothetical protein